MASISAKVPFGVSARRDFSSGVGPDMLAGAYCRMIPAGKPVPMLPRPAIEDL
jgi:hypothetical protein